jgi:hypothetical protein
VKINGEDLVASAPFASGAEVNAAIYSIAFRKDVTDNEQQSELRLQ